MPAFVSGVVKVRRLVFVLGAAIAGAGWIGMNVVLSNFLGAEIAERIGDAGVKVVRVAFVADRGAVRRSQDRGRDSTRPPRGRSLRHGTR